MPRATAISHMETRDDLYANAMSWVREHPLQGLGIAFGVGYLLGGGLWSRLTGRLVGMGLRVGVATLARNLITQAQAQAH